MAQNAGSERDTRHLMRAVELAGEARGMTSPNPMVGAVIVKDGRVIGEGLHAAAGEPHAERMALEACTESPTGATMYVSLEPCCHTGRTPPCTDAIVESGIRRVVIASDDPTTKASGRGLGILRDEGVSVEVLNGEVAEQARLINQPFRKHARTGKPLVILKSAMTLDGKVATSTGHSQWISGQDSRARAHRWRAECDAVAIGIGTALADDPLLTARVEAVAHQPKRVIFDSEARLPLDGKLARSLDEAPVIVVCSRAAPRRRVQALEAAGITTITVTGQNETSRIAPALTELGSLEVQSLLVEGGPHLAGALADADEFDEMRVFVAPIVAGGRRSRTAVEGQGVELVGEAMRSLDTEVERIGDDVLICARLREW